MEYGTVPDLLKRHGYGGPGKKNATEALKRYQDEGGQYLATSALRARGGGRS